MNHQAENSISWFPAARPAVWWAALLLGTLYFLSDHSVYVSLAQDFTQDADGMLETVEGGNPFRRLAYLSIAALGVGFFVSQPSRMRPTILGGLILATAALSFASVLWAQDRGLCLRRLLVLGMALFGMFGVASKFTLKEICLIALSVSVGCVLIGLGCEIALGTFRPWLSDYRFSGTVHPNTQGVYLATICFASLALAVADAPRRKLYGSLLCGAIVLLILTKSRTSTAGVLASLGLVVLALSPPRVRWLFPVLGIGAAATGLLLLLLSGADADALIAKFALMGREEEAESFSGRTTIWPVLQPYIDHRFWLGHGYESFWTPGVIDSVTTECQWAVREAHSAYREILLGLGFVGLMLFCTAALVGMGNSVYEYFTRRDATALFWFGMIVNGFFNGMFESGMVWISVPTFFIAVGLMRMAFFNPVTEPVLAWQPRLRTSHTLGMAP